MKTLLSSRELKKTIQKMSEEISHFISTLSKKSALPRGEGEDIILVGIQTRGVILAKRVHEILGRGTLQRSPTLGSLDINLYRDDFSSMKKIPIVQKTEIPGDVEGKGIILFDEVLYTGRTIRAALDALMDLGRPRFIKLAVLVDRGGRELPIQPDYLGIRHQINPQQEIEVRFEEIDGEEEVRVHGTPSPS